MDDTQFKVMDERIEAFKKEFANEFPIDLTDPQYDGLIRMAFMLGLQTFLVIEQRDPGYWEHHLDAFGYVRSN